MKSDWIWMPHVGHLCVGHMCRFHLNTYVNGYIVSTVGEYFPPSDLLRRFIEIRKQYPKLGIGIDGKIQESKPLTDEQLQELLDLKGDSFDAAYLHIFGYEDIGWNRKYETMVFKATAQSNSLAQCCPYEAEGSCLEMNGYNDPKDAYEGHMELCQEWNNKIPGSEFQECKD